MNTAVLRPGFGRPPWLHAGFLLSLLVHLALLLWLAGWKVTSPEPGTTIPRPLEVRWLPPAEPAAARPPKIASRPARTRARERIAVAPPQAATTATVNDTTVPPSPAPPSAAPPAAAAPWSLDLRVPPVPAAPSPAGQAMADPRANVRSAPVDAMARRLTGTTHRTEQRMARGWVVREGTRCWEVRPARANDLHPFDATMQPIPHGVRSCEDD
ncbi:hypothetical protein M8A51_07950 [Schlegelella sp. S2-27]|uniref:Protein TonB n=1 Tax=Caldimonas mangrovi TaxID=2944811 RepID=A0ABT0YL54_9BURK|nr:hypothetical protein [Caldimonas mangrovi]MCM5679461.1 hypothetical protein [Caldimonas mangrovi]